MQLSLIAIISLILLFKPSDSRITRFLWIVIQLTKELKDYYLTKASEFDVVDVLLNWM